MPSNRKQNSTVPVDESMNTNDTPSQNISTSQTYTWVTQASQTQLATLSSIDWDIRERYHSINTPMALYLQMENLYKRLGDWQWDQSERQQFTPYLQSRPEVTGGKQLLEVLRRELVADMEREAKSLSF